MFSVIMDLALKSLLFFALHFENRNNFPKPLSKKDELECLKLVAQGDEAARIKLIEHNLRLVSYIVKKHYSESREQDDLISIGTIGLLKAVETFDSEKNTSFSTYAGRCIDNQIKMHFRKIKRQQTEVYLDAPIDTDKDGNQLTMADIFKDLTCVSDEVDLRIDTERLYRYINETLDERERMILCNRYGLVTSQGVVSRPLAQREVAEKLGISRSYVSRIEKKALKKLSERFERND